jgi:hypothetical protein
MNFERTLIDQSAYPYFLLTASTQEYSRIFFKLFFAFLELSGPNFLMRAKEKLIKIF